MDGGSADSVTSLKQVLELSSKWMSGTAIFHLLAAEGGADILETHPESRIQCLQSLIADCNTIPGNKLAPPTPGIEERGHYDICIGPQRRSPQTEYN